MGLQTQGVFSFLPNLELEQPTLRSTTHIVDTPSCTNKTDLLTTSFSIEANEWIELSKL